MTENLARKCIMEHPDYIPGKPVEEVQRELGLSDIIKMASNENPMGASPKAIKAMEEELVKNISRYPVSLCTELSEKLAARLGVKPSQIFLDNGEDAVITMFGLTFINEGDEVIASESTFAAYGNITAKMGGKYTEIPLTPEGDYNLDGIAAALNDNTKIIFICNPNNPTGKMLTHNQIVEFLKKIPEDVLVALDEAYGDFADSAEYPKSLELLPEYPNLVIMRTFSKLYGLASLRCGYAVASEEIVRVMLKAREPFPVNRIAQVGAIAALDDEEFVQATLENNREGRQMFYKAFDEMGLFYYPSHTNFVFVDLGEEADPVYQKMLREGVIVRGLASMGFPNALRITIGLPEENERTIRALEKCL